MGLATEMQAVGKGLAAMEVAQAGRGKGFRPGAPGGAATIARGTVAAQAKGADEDRRWGWKSFGEQLRAVRDNGRNKSAIDPRLKALPTGLGETIGSDGGFLIAPQWADGILEIMHQEENLLDRTDSYTCTSNSLTVRAVDETSRATGSRRGGVTGYWLDEADAGTASKPKFKTITLKPHKLGVFVYVTEELLEDGGGMLEQFVSRVAAEEINWLVSDSIFNGTGVGMPRGIMNSAALVTIAKESGQVGGSILAENIVNMWARLHVSARKNAVWFVNQDVEPVLHLMNVNIGVGGQLVYMPPGGLSERPYATLYGRPVIATEFNQTRGTVGDIILGDLKHVISVTRGAVKTNMSMHVEFLTDQLVYKFTFRVDAQPWWASALTPAHGTATQGPFVALATRS